MQIVKYFLLILIIFTAQNFYSQLQAQSVRGNGNVIKQDRVISSFNEIDGDGAINVFLKQGNSESLTVETDENLLSYVETFVNGNKLIIRNKKDANIKKKTKMDVYVTLRDIKKLTSNGVGNIKTESVLNLSSLHMDNNGVGNVDLNIDSEELTADVKSVGNITLSGNVKNVSIDHNGVGNIKAFDLSADILKIQINGVGNSEVNSNGELYMDLNGMGNISYRGNPVIKHLNKNGLGKIQKM